MRNRSSGFTLIELMVVMVVIAFFSSIVVISIGDNFYRTLKSEAERFQTVAGALSDEAVFSAQDLGVYLTDTSYEVLVLDRVQGQWLPLQDSVFRRYAVDPSIKVTWLVEEKGFDDNTDVEEDIIEPHILFLSSGESTVYSVDFAGRDEPQNQPVFEVSSNGFSAPNLEEISKR